MIDRKISELTELITPAVNDLLPIVDVSVDGFETKYVTVTNLVAGAVGAPSNAEYVTLALNVGLSDERVLVGTANQIVITDGGAGGNVTLSTPQDIAVGSSPTFAGLTINGNITVTGTVDGVDVAALAVAVGLISVAEFVTISADPTLPNERILTGTANQIIITDGGAGLAVTLSTPQDIHAAATPVFAGLTINGNIGVTGTVDGVDIAGANAAQYVMIALDANLANERVLTGTANQITVTDGGAGGNVTLSLPQDIDTSADVAFDSLVLDDLTASRLVASDGGEKLVSTDLFAWVAGTANRVTVADDADGTITLSGPQDIAAASSPVFAGLTINGNITVTGTVDGVDIAGIADAQYVVIAADGDLANERILTGTANQVIVTDGGAGLAVTLSTPQDIHTGATPQFAKIGIGTATIPHGGVGGGIVAIEGADVSVAAGPHIQFTTASDDHPLFQILPWSHDNIQLRFDCYFDGAEKSSDVGSNYKFTKENDRITLQYDSGIAAGGAITWNPGWTLDTSGRIAIGQLAATAKLIINGSADEVQLIVQAHSTQNSNLMLWQNSGLGTLSGVSGDGRFGIGVAPQSNKMMYVQKTGITDLAGTWNAYGCVIETAPAAPTTLVTTAGNFKVTLKGSAAINSTNFGADVTSSAETASAVSGLRGGRFFALNNGAGTVTNAWGGDFNCTTQNGGRIVVGNAGFFKITAAGGGDILIGSGVYIATPGGADTITTAYGLYIQAQNRGNTDYAIYTNAGQVRFGDYVTIDQASAGGAQPVLSLDQADEDYVLLKVIATAAAASADRTLVADADFGTPGALVGWIQIEIDDVGNRIADGDYYMPIYAVPT